MKRALTALAITAALTITACTPGNVNATTQRDCTVTGYNITGDTQTVRTRECGTLHTNPGAMFLIGQMYAMTLNNSGGTSYINKHYKTTPQKARQRAEKAAKQEQQKKQQQQKQQATKPGTYKPPAPNGYKAPAPAPRPAPVVVRAR